MKIFSLLAAVLTISLTLTTSDAEAKRIGAGKSSGMQRQMSTPDKAPTAAAPAAASTAAKAPAAAAAQPKRSWMGPLAGLAAGLGLAALASHFGFGEELASMLMIGLLIMAVVVAIGFIMRRRAAAQQPAMAGAGGLQYAASGADDAAPAARSADLSVAGGSGASAGASAAEPAGAAAAVSRGSIPAGFDVAGFERNAKVHFIRLQAANDAGNLDDIREFTTPEMFAELKMNLSERGDAAQETDVVTIAAAMVEVVEEANRYVASVRFTGSIREEKNGPVEAIDEIWHLVKPREGEGGWLLGGIQQIQ